MFNPNQVREGINGRADLPLGPFPPATHDVFEDSSEATDFMCTVMQMLSSPKLQNWVENTDALYGTNSAPHFALAKVEFNKCFDILNEAE